MKKAFLAFLLAFLIPSLAAAQAGRKKVHQGNSLYKEKKYDAALGKYQDALLDAPDSPRIRFNVGNALYQKNSHEKAVDLKSGGRPRLDVPKRQGAHLLLSDDALNG